MTDTMWIITTFYVICGIAAYPIWFFCENEFAKILGKPYSRIRKIIGFICCLIAGIFALMLSIYLWIEIIDWRKERRNG